MIQARIAERLGRSAPSVSEMLDRLIEDGYVTRRGRRLTLTDSGRALAEKVVRKHRLAERLLVDVIGLEWHKVHREAGRWEHVISDDVEARLVELLGDPATCPHGNPIPGRHTGRRPWRAGRWPRSPRASGCASSAISEEVEMHLGSLALLDESGFIPGAVARVGGRDAEGNVEVTVEGAAGPSGSRATSPAGCSSAHRDAPAGGRRRVHRRRGRHRAGAGRGRDRRRRHLVGRRPLAGPRGSGDRGAPLGRM